MLDRRHFLASLPAAALLPKQIAAQPSLSRQRAFLGTTGNEGQGIFFAYFDSSTGAFTQPEFASKFTANDCMALSPKKPARLYATCAVEGVASVVGFDIVEGPSPLKQITLQSAKGTIANYLSFDPSGHVAMEANWGSGSINTYTVDRDGVLSAPVEHIEYGDADHGPQQPQQVHSRAHSILVAPGGRFVLVNDYGADRIRIYTLDAATGRLTPSDPAFWHAEPGSAPRHLVVHPNGRWIYNNNELSNKVDLLLWDSKRGTLERKESWSTIPADAPPKCRTADMMLSPDSRFLYGSVRTLESLMVWAVGRDGGLQQIQFMKQSGVENRHICLDATGRWLIASNVRSNSITVFPRDPKTGMLGEQKSSATLPGACFVLWA